MTEPESPQDAPRSPDSPDASNSPPHRDVPHGSGSASGPTSHRPSADEPARTAYVRRSRPIRPPDEPVSSNLPRNARIAIGLLAAASLAVVLFVLFYGQFYGGRILPGVRVAGVEVGGMSPEAAAERLKPLAIFHEPVTLRDPKDGRTWSFGAPELGVRDPLALATTAFEVGRGGPGDPMALEANPLTRGWHQLQIWREGYDLPGGWIFDAGKAEAALKTLAPKVDVPPKNAEFKMVNGAPELMPSELGRQLDIPETLKIVALALDDPLRAAAEDQPLVADIATTPTGARVPDLNNVADAYERITSSPITLTYRSQTRFPVSLEQLKAWTSLTETLNENGDQVAAISMDRPAIAKWLEPVAATLNHPARNARFSFEDEAFKVKDPGISGLVLDIPASVEKVIEAAYSEIRSGELAATVQQPEVGPTLLSEIGDIEELTAAYTRSAGGLEGRTRSLELAAAQIDGTLLPPGAEFSFNRALGEVSAERGYDLAFVKPTAGTTGTVGVPAELGEAIAQVATTVFRAAFWAGLPITERHASPTRVGWVEPPVGLDAAVNGADMDLAFANDSPGYVFLIARMDTQRGALTVKLWGLARNRKVEVTGPFVTNLTLPSPAIVRRVPGLAAGSMGLVSRAREGADARVERIVRQGGTVVARDVFESHYAPAGDVTAVGAP